MPQCQGTTKAGERCKRDANEESGFCSTHTDQGVDGAADADDAPESRVDRRATDLLLIGAVALGFMLLRRVIRF